MATAIVLREHGGPEVLRLEPVEVGPPGPGEVRLRQVAIGVNYHDVYTRDGSYAAWMALPGIPGWRRPAWSRPPRTGRASRRATASPT